MGTAIQGMDDLMSSWFLEPEPISTSVAIVVHFCEKS